MPCPHLSSYMSLLMMLLSIMTLLTSFTCIIHDQSFTFEFELLQTSSATFSFPIIVDFMSSVFFSFVSFISAAVILYSKDYMKADPLSKRFMFLMLMFISSMFFLIFSLNMISIMLGWDGLGLTSYILVTYYQNSKANAAGMITALSNRVGDAALLLALGFLSSNGSWNFLQTPVNSLPPSTTVFIVLAAFTKSAQMPFSAWLPAAMAAPTPVSALVHSSTLVTAGIYILIRFSPPISQSPLPGFIFPLASLTTLMASIAACLETDLKKIVALSTLSQLGLMMATFSCGFPLLTFFHLLTHAMFKALLFLAAGKIIHEANSSQDIRSMGSIMNALPLSSAALNTANLALCGIPFLAGFYSKDLVVETILMSNSSPCVWTLLFLGVGLSASYSIRMSFSGLQNFNQQNALFTSSEKTTPTSLAMLLLSSMTILSGAVLAWLMFPDPCPIILDSSLKATTSLAVLTGSTLGMLLSMKTPFKTFMLSKLVETLSLMWFLTSLSGNTTSNSLLRLATKTKTLEMGWLEYGGSQGLFSSLSDYSSAITKSQSQPLSLFLIFFATISLLSLLP